MASKFEKLRNPKGNEAVVALFLSLDQQFKLHGFAIAPDKEFGGLGTDKLGLNVDNLETRKNQGFMEIIFNPNDWAVIVPQNKLGMESLQALAQILGRQIDDANIATTWNNDYACYAYFFPANSPKQTLK